MTKETSPIRLIRKSSTFVRIELDEFATVLRNALVRIVDAGAAETEPVGLCRQPFVQHRIRPAASGT